MCVSLVSFGDIALCVLHSIVSAKSPSVPPASGGKRKAMRPAPPLTVGLPITLSAVSRFKVGQAKLCRSAG